MKEAEASPSVGLAALPGLAAVAMIDDGLRPMRLDLIPEDDRERVVALLLDDEVLPDLAERGVDAEMAAADPGGAIEALTMPSLPHGMALAKLSDVSAQTVRMIERRHSMRQIAEAIRTTGTCEVLELGPEDDLADIARFDVVFIDYFLDDADRDGSIAERIATDVQHRRDAERRQQIVLMSSAEGVRAVRTQFRKNARIPAASFSFVDKRDLDEDWKVRAHLEMLARGMKHSQALGDYIDAVKQSARSAAEKLAETVDDLDIGDFAYIQRIALHADGHPLGDYLSWLLSCCLTANAFEGELRSQQAAVDAMEFEDGPLSPAEPSVAVASLYHDALFARNLGPLGPHPRAAPDSPLADVPFTQLGDVFLSEEMDRAVVVLSPDCDLAFSTDASRTPDRSLGVILVYGDPNSVVSEADEKVDASTEGMVRGTEVYRVDWRFSTFQTVPLVQLREHLLQQGFDVHKRDRLRPLYSLKLQHELGSHLTRVGPPVMPPIAHHKQSRIRIRQNEGFTSLELGPDEIVVSRYKKDLSIRLTPSLVTKLKAASSSVLADMQVALSKLPSGGDRAAEKFRRDLTAKVTALQGQVDGHQVWLGLLGDHLLPPDGQIRKLRGSVHLAHGAGWQFPAQPAVVLIVGAEPPADPDAEVDSEGTAMATPVTTGDEMIERPPPRAVETIAPDEPETDADGPRRARLPKSR